MSQILLTAAAVASLFNLECAGTRSITDINGTKNEPYASVIRMDLDAKKWCEGECKALFDFADIGPTQLTLKKEDVNTVTEKQFTSSTINRETGEQSILLSSGRRERLMILQWKGQCEKKPFTGFPSFQTKF